MESVRSWMDGPVLQAGRIIDALHLLIQPGDRIVLEGDNQKQADFLSPFFVHKRRLKSVWRETP
jgi:malonate decarboxylase alpha subunit